MITIEDLEYFKICKSNDFEILAPLENAFELIRDILALGEDSPMSLCYNSKTGYFYLVAIKKGSDFSKNYDGITKVFVKKGSYTNYIDEIDQCSSLFKSVIYVPLEEFIKAGFEVKLVHAETNETFVIPADNPEIKDFYVRSKRTFFLENWLRDSCETLEYPIVKQLAPEVERLLSIDPDFSFIPKGELTKVGQILTAFFATIYGFGYSALYNSDRFGISPRILIRSDGRFKVSFLEKGGNRKFSGADVDTKSEYEISVFLYNVLTQQLVLEVLCKQAGVDKTYVTLLLKVLSMLVLLPSSPINEIFGKMIIGIWKDGTMYFPPTKFNKAVYHDGIVEFVKIPGQTVKTIEGLTID